MTAPKGNKFAAKPENQHRSSGLRIAVTPREKARLVKAAHPGKLAPYIRHRLGLEP